MDKHKGQMDEAAIRREIIKKKKHKMMVRRLIFASLAILLTVLGSRSLGKHLGEKAYSDYNKEPVVVMSDMPIVKAAESAIGNLGGGPYWSWYGFDSRVEWCACFASWAANESGALNADTAPKFAYVPEGYNWFVARDLWLEPSKTPSAGDMIFFDWEQDGGYDHVGIVASVIDDKVFTIEGNSSNRCRVKCYSVGDAVICGYGQIAQ